MLAPATPADFIKVRRVTVESVIPLSLTVHARKQSGA